MKVLSFAWTTPALLAGEKTCTRRDWKPRHAALFKKGDLCRAYDRNPRNGGRPVATICLIEDAYLENTLQAPEIDYHKEGFTYLEKKGVTLGGITPAYLWEQWKTPPGEELWVVRFELVELVS